MSTIWTCQCCGRAIQARRRVIAHHGYKRPGEGYQTSSCFGARELPFELAHDRLDLAIASVESRLSSTRAHLAEFVAEPPAELVEFHRYAGRVTGQTKHTRPEGFNPRDIGPRKFIPGTYEREFTRRHGDSEVAIRRAEADLKFFRARRAEWQAPTDALRAAWLAYAGKPAKKIRPEFA